MNAAILVRGSGNVASAVPRLLFREGYKTVMCGAASIPGVGGIRTGLAFGEMVTAGQEPRPRPPSPT
jgi:glutamate dehydrogenase/leucine dehydrogenase